MDAIREWWDGNSTRAWRGLVVLLFTVSVSVVSWLAMCFIEIKSEMPDKFVAKTDYKSDQDNINRTLERIEGKTDEINRFLRDRGY
jgi:hypothetical protein